MLSNGLCCHSLASGSILFFILSGSISFCDTMRSAALVDKPYEKEVVFSVCIMLFDSRLLFFGVRSVGLVCAIIDHVDTLGWNLVALVDVVAAELRNGGETGGVPGELGEETVVGLEANLTISVHCFRENGIT